MVTQMSKYSRRAVLKTLGLGAATLATPLTAVSRQQEKGPLVWLDMTQEALNAAYSQSDYAPNASEVIARYRSNSTLVRQRLGDPLRFSYGEKGVEAMDVFPTDAPNAPVHIFIHGGAWQQGSATAYAFPAEMFVNAGVHYLAPDFSWIQDVGDSLYPIVDQLQRAIAWVYENAGKFGGDPEQIFISGHSSGGHLAGVLLTTDWESKSLPKDIIKGGLCCSGIFDLKPVRLSHRGEYIAFTDEMEHAFSPMRHIEHLHAPVIVACGTNETREFVRHSRDFSSAIEAAGKQVQLILAENYNHFEVIETLANPYGSLGRAALDQINNPPG